MKINIFISYSSQDAIKKNALKKAILKKKGLLPIVVEDYRRNGIEFTEKVKADLERAHYFVPILTAKSYQKSQWLNQEIGFAFARFPKEKIFPIAQKSIIKKLKGFIHDKAEISYNFDSTPTNPKKERFSFRKCINELLTDILQKENLDNEKGLSFQAVVKSEYEPTIYTVDEPITSDLKFHVKINLTSLSQIARFYYRIVTDRQEFLWVGFTDKELKPDGYIREKENSQQFNKVKSLTYDFTDSVLSTVQDRLLMMNRSGFRFLGKPIKVVEVQFRGDKVIHDPIHYYYVFE